MSFFGTLRDYADNKINESTLQSATIGANSDDDISEYENDVEFMQECTADCMGLILESMMLGDYGEELDESVQNAVLTLQNYFIGQGLISEAAVSINNPRANIVRLNPKAQLARLASIITLKMGRRANHNAYKKYKLGQKIKKDNMAKLRAMFGDKAEKLAKKIWKKTRKSGKVNAVVADSKKK